MSHVMRTQAQIATPLSAMVVVDARAKDIDALIQELCERDRIVEGFHARKSCFKGLM